MIRAFLALVFLGITMVLSVMLHYFTFPKIETAQPLLTLSQLTNQTTLSLSTAYTEKKVNPVYPEMPSLKRMDFIYE
jgi:hypothetical protein